jgi:hypothetical protein
MESVGSLGIRVTHVAQASSLHMQDACATLGLLLLITTKSEEPICKTENSSENKQTFPPSTMEA